MLGCSSYLLMTLYDDNHFLDYFYMILEHI